MLRIVLGTILLCLLIGGSEVFGIWEQEPGCFYHHKGRNIEATDIFMQLWRRGCDSVTFIQYAPGPGHYLYFKRSPCLTYTLKLAFGGPPRGAVRESSIFHQAAWGKWLYAGQISEDLFNPREEMWIGRAKHDNSGFTLWCVRSDWTSMVWYREKLIPSTEKPLVLPPLMSPEMEETPAKERAIASNPAPVTATTHAARDPRDYVQQVAEKYPFLYYAYYFGPFFLFSLLAHQLVTFLCYQDVGRRRDGFHQVKWYALVGIVGGIVLFVGPFFVLDIETELEGLHRTFGPLIGLSLLVVFVAYAGLKNYLDKLGAKFIEIKIMEQSSRRGPKKHRQHGFTKEWRQEQIEEITSNPLWNNENADEWLEDWQFKKHKKFVWKPWLCRWFFGEKDVEFTRWLFEQDNREMIERWALIRGRSIPE